jgi:hypothetical protein
VKYDLFRRALAGVIASNQTISYSGAVQVAVKYAAVAFDAVKNDLQIQMEPNVNPKA